MTGAHALANLVKMLDEPTPRAQAVVALLAGLSDRWRQAYRTEMARRGFPWHETAAGDLIDHLPAEGISQSAMTARTGLTKQAVQQLLDQLEQQGVLRREADPADRRARRIVLTELGRRDLDERQAVLDGIEAQARAALGKKDFKKLRKMLRALS